MLRVMTRQDKCELFTDRSGEEWVEIFIPPLIPDEYQDLRNFPSIMVAPRQVYFLNDFYNLYEINAGAYITGICRDIDRLNNFRRNLDRCQMWSEEIIARSLQYELWAYHKLDRFMQIRDPNIRLVTIYKDYLSSGKRMEHYIKG